MSEKPNPIETAEDEFEAIMPEGWTGDEGADIFNPSTWGLSGDPADAQDDEEDEGEGNPAEETGARTRTTEEGDGSQTDAANEEDPTTAQNQDADDKLRFRVDIDHVPQDVELDPAELPAIYQKAQVLDRYQRRTTEQDAELARWDALAAGLNFESRTALLDGLLENAIQDYVAEHPSIPEEMARDYVMRKFQGAKAPEAEPEKKDSVPAQRDYRQEVADLFRTYPQARTEKIPDEVTRDALSMGKPLVQAYADWKARTASADAARATRENKILKQNQAAAARAPVSKTTGGGRTDNKPVDDFLRGFEDDAAW